jgi:DNA helicase-2/ATP-dependent DNA helicase PcrA
MSDPFDLTDDPPPPVAAARHAAPIWLEGLNPEQLRAVETTEGPVLVLSGAGTGKTKVLTSRLANIIAGRRAQPWQCLAVTFTNKAAREMKERVSGMIGPVAEGIWLGTFHSTGVRMLRDFGERVGLKSNFTILDTDDQIRLLKQIMEAERIDAKKWPAQALLSTIQRWKDRGLTPAKVKDEAGTEFAAGRAVALYAEYQERLRILNAADFGDLLLHCLTVFSDPEHADILRKYQDRFRYILVDEYQDTNIAQYLWLRLLAQKHRNLCCVGDDDQSIYSWRGAEVGNILKFEHDFPGCAVIRLERNYRSTSHILAAASGLIAHNAGRLGKTLRPGAPHADSGEKIVLRGVWDGEEEARVVVEEIEQLQRRGENLKTMAILVRAGFQTREFEERLIVTGVPYRVVGGPRFYERQEVRDALAYLRVVQSADDGLAFERIVNVPKRGLGEATLQLVHTLSRAQGVSLVEASRRLVETDEIKPKARSALSALLRDLDRWRAMSDGLPPGELCATVLEESGYTDMWKADKTAEAPGRLENLKELVASLENYEHLQEFLEHVSLVMENDANASGDRVSLMTLHAAKGLEFDSVFLPGWEEGVFPHQRALDESGAQGLEEERRLAYVGLTRARRRVLVSFAANRRIYNQWQSALPSRFVDEIPADTVERLSDTGLHQNTRDAYGSDWGGGWSAPRAQSFHRRTAPVIETTWSTDSVVKSETRFKLGDRVFHQKFGYGQITSLDGNKLEIAFDKAGTKKVIDSFVTAA